MIAETKIIDKRKRAIDSPLYKYRERWYAYRDPVR